MLSVKTTPKMPWEYSENMWKNGYGKRVGWTTTVWKLGRQSVQQHAERKARQNEHQWRRWQLDNTAHQRLRGASHRALPQTVPLNARASYTSSTLTLAQVRALSALSLHHHGHPCGCYLFTLISSFYLFTFLLSVVLFTFFHLSDEQKPELNKKIMENLRHSAANGGEDTYDVLYLHRLWAQRSWLQRAHRSPSPPRSLTRTRTWMTWHSARSSLKRTEDKTITSYKKACQSVSCRRL